MELCCMHQRFSRYRLNKNIPCLAEISKNKLLRGRVCFSVKRTRADASFGRMVAKGQHDLAEVPFFLLVRGQNLKKPLPNRVIKM